MMTRRGGALTAVQFSTGGGEEVGSLAVWLRCKNIKRPCMDAINRVRAGAFVNIWDILCNIGRFSVWSDSFFDLYKF